MILGGVNFGSTFLGLYVVENFGRRKSLIFGGLWMFVMFMIFASMGHFLLQMGEQVRTAGYVMIVVTCLFIFVYAQTWVSSWRYSSKKDILYLHLVRPLLSGPSLLRSTRLATEQQQWALQQPVIGLGVSHLVIFWNFPSTDAELRLPARILHLVHY